MIEKNAVDKDKLIKLNSDTIKSLLSIKIFRILKVLLLAYAVFMMFLTIIDILAFIMAGFPSNIVRPDMILFMIISLIVAPVSSTIFAIIAYDNIKELYEISSDARDVYPIKALGELQNTLFIYFILHCAEFVKTIIRCLGGSIYIYWFTPSWFVISLDYSDSFNNTSIIATETIFLAALGIWCYYVNNMAQTLILNFQSDKIFGKSCANKLIFLSIIFLITFIMYYVSVLVSEDNILNLLFIFFFIIVSVIPIIATIIFGKKYSKSVNEMNVINKHASTIQEKEFDGKGIYIESFTEYQKDTTEYNPNNYSTAIFDIYKDESENK